MGYNLKCPVRWCRHGTNGAVIVLDRRLRRGNTDPRRASCSAADPRGGSALALGVVIGPGVLGLPDQSSAPPGRAGGLLIRVLTGPVSAAAWGRSVEDVDRHKDIQE